jgi:hypothetical protein
MGGNFSHLARSSAQWSGPSAPELAILCKGGFVGAKQYALVQDDAASSIRFQGIDHMLMTIPLVTSTSTLPRGPHGC